MKVNIIFAVLNLSMQAMALPAAASELQDASVPFGVPRMITPKYRSSAKRAIIRYPAFTLAAKGVSIPKFTADSSN
jgi:hypothetical protein